MRVARRFGDQRRIFAVGRVAGEIHARVQVSQAGGVGLGLAIASRAVELHNGTIRARNVNPGLLVESGCLAISRRGSATGTAPLLSRLRMSILNTNPRF